MTSEAEIQAAVMAVRAASELCSAAQGQLVPGDTLTKGDESPVTVADFAAQAVVCAELTDALGSIDMVGEEDSDDLRAADRSDLREGVVRLVRRQRGDRVSESSVVDWIAVGSSDGASDRYWTLDPIDGTKGFLRGEQYAIALALIERGEVLLGVLGCPNLPNSNGTRGAVFLATPGSCVAYYGSSTRAFPIRVASPDTVTEARFCESVESGHSNQDQAAQIASLRGSRSRRCFDLLAAPDSRRLSREDLGPRSRQVRCGTSRWQGHRRRRSAA